MPEAVRSLGLARFMVGILRPSTTAGASKRSAAMLEHLARNHRRQEKIGPQWHINNIK
jgi:hypothetical protein